MSHLSFFVLFLTPFLAFIFHGALNYLGSMPPTKGALGAIGLSINSVFLTVFLIEEHRSSSAHGLLFTLICSVLLGHLYFQVFNLSETARRIHLLVTLKKRGKLPQEAAYAPKEMIQLRLKRLEALSQLSNNNGVYEPKLTPLLLVALVLRSLERFVYPRRTTI